MAEKLKKWFDVSYDLIMPAGNIEEGINKTIARCDYFFVVFDINTFMFPKYEDVLAKKYIIRELKTALEFQENNNLKIIPILRNDCNMKDIVSQELPSKSDYKNNKQKEKIKELINDIEYVIKNIRTTNGIKYPEDIIADEFFPQLFEFIDSENYHKQIYKEKTLKTISLIVKYGAVVGFTCLSIFLYKYFTNEPTIVFAGGGSVANMIKNITNNSVDITNYRNAIYLNLPSQNAWPLLTEEVIVNHTYSNENKFYPVCLSALMANDSVFHKIIKPNEFMKRATVLQYFLGKDTLRVFTNENMGKQDTINIDELSHKVKECYKDKLVYITQEGSGTYHIYQKIMKHIVDIDTCKSNLEFYDKTLLKKNLTKKYIVLASQFYTPDDIRDLPSKVVVDTDAMPIMKDMYLYFLGYTKEDINYFSLPEVMVDFLKQIDRDSDNIIRTQMYIKEKMIITPFDSLKNWEREHQNHKK